MKVELSAEAENVRDQIIEHLMEDEFVEAIKLYRSYTGRGQEESNNVILSLDKVLHKPGLSEAEESFLEAFRISLAHPERPARQAKKTGQRPAGKQSKSPKEQQKSSKAGPVPLLLYTLFAQLFIVILGLGFMFLFGSLAHYSGRGLAAVLAMVVAVPIFMFFPNLIHLVLLRTSVLKWTRSPGYLYGHGLGLIFMWASLLAAYSYDQYLWLQHSSRELINDPEALVIGLGPEPRLSKNTVYEMPQVKSLRGPMGWVTRHHPDKGGSWSESFIVIPVVSQDRAAGSTLTNDEGIEVPSCLWLGWKTYSKSGLGIDDPLSPKEKSDFYHYSTNDQYYANPYYEAVAKALNLETTPACTTVINRILPPEQFKTKLELRLRYFVYGIGAAPWVLLCIYGGVVVYQRLRRT